MIALISTRLTVVRLGAAPDAAARAALLRDSAVLGTLANSADGGEATLDAMARASAGAKKKAPRVVGCGELLSLDFAPSQIRADEPRTSRRAAYQAVCEDGVCRSEVVQLSPTADDPCGPPSVLSDGDDAAMLAKFAARSGDE